MTKQPNHVHKLKRLTYKSTGHKIFFCVLPECHYKVAVELALGKNNICNRCGSAFQLDEYSIRLAKPHCKKCRKKKDDVPSPEKITSAIAEHAASDLRSRLSQTVAVANDDDEL